MFFRFFCFIATIFCSFLFGEEIRECSSLKEVLNIVQPDTLYIFDIDNTLMRPCQELGSDEWVEYNLQKAERQADTSTNIANEKRKVIETWAAVQVLTKMRLIEEEAPFVIASLQKAHVPIMILTSRNESVLQTTFEQLNAFSIDITKSLVWKDNFFLTEFPGALFYNGILFTNGGNKGAVLTAFLHQIGYKPKRIVFIDDKQSNLKSVARVEQEGIDFLGLRYNRADAIVRSFDALIADRELNHLRNSLLSDEAARK